MRTVELSDETETLLDAHLSRGGFGTADELLRFALSALDGTRGEDYEDLDEETRAAIEEAEASYERGEARPWSEVRAELLAKYCKRAGQP